MLVTVRRGVYPGTFNPLTIAHLAIADAAVAQLSLDRLDLAISRVSLAKEALDPALLAPRVAALERAAGSRPAVGVVVTDAQLLADVAQGYDVLVVGGDKWAQLHDPVFYGGSQSARDEALARLPAVAIVPRPPFPVPEGATLIEVPSGLHEVSASAVRDGRTEWLAPEGLAAGDSG